MAISFVGQATANATTVTLPPHQAGDLILIAAYRNNSTTVPTNPAEWTSLFGAGSQTNAMRVGYFIATSSDTVSGTWTNASHLVAMVYRAGAGGSLAVGAVAGQGGTGTSINYPNLTLQDISGASWLVAFGGHRSNTSTTETPPTGFVNRAKIAGASAGSIGAHDTDGPRTTNFVQTGVVVGTSTGWRANVVEITETGGGAATYTGNGAATFGALEGAGAGTASVPTYSGSGTATLPAPQGAGTGTVAVPVYTGNGASILPALSGAGSGTRTLPVTGTGSATLPDLTATGAAYFAAPGSNGTGAATLPAISAQGFGAFFAPVHQATGSATIPAFVAAGEGSAAAPGVVGIGDAALPALLATGAGTRTVPLFGGSGAANLPSFSAIGAASFALPGIVGVGSASLPMLAAAGAGQQTIPVFTGNGGALLGALVVSGQGEAEVPVSIGAGQASLPPLQAFGQGSAVAPVEHIGQGVAHLPLLVVAGSGRSFRAALRTSTVYRAGFDQAAGTRRDDAPGNLDVRPRRNASTGSRMNRQASAIRRN